MDMKKILQALDGASTKPVEGSNDMKQYLRLVKEADLNQPTEPPMPGQNMPPAQVNLDQIDAKTLDSAEGFKAAMKQAATEAGVEPETTQMVDKLVAAAPDGTVDVEKTFVKIAVMFGDAMGELVLMLQDLIKAYENAMSSPEFAQFDAATKQSVKEALAGLKAELPKIMANAKKMSADAKGMQAQTAPAPQVTNEQTGMSRFLSIVTEGKGPLNRLTAAESIALNHYSEQQRTITSPVLNVAKDAKPSMIGKYFKTVSEELLEAEQRHKERASQLAKRVVERVTIGPDGKMSPSMADWSRMKASGEQPSPEPASSATLPGKDLPKAEKADRQAMTVTVAGQEYKMVMLEPGGIRPRGGQRIAIPQAVMGERGIGNYIGILAGSSVYVLPRGEQESVEQISEELEQLFDLRNKIEEAIKQRLDPKCWKGKKIGNPKTKIKGGVRVNNCVPAEEAVSPAQQAAIAVNMKKAGKKPKTEGLKDPADNPCWTGYKPVGTKKKAGKTVPNCVPKEAVQKTGTAGQLRGKDKVDVKGTVLGSPEKSQKSLRNKLVGGGA